jgi:hypothetical protein
MALRARVCSALAPMLLLLHACGQDYEVEAYVDPDTLGQDEPDIEVEPDTLAFAAIGVGELATLEVSIRNRGTQELAVDHLAIEGTGAFTVLEGDVPFAVPPDGEVRRTIQFSPANLVDEGTAWVYSNDPDSGRVPIALAGGALAPELLVTPDPYDFGFVKVGCSLRSGVNLANVGTAPLSVSSIVPTSPAFTVEPPALPLSIAAGESVDVPVVFTPPAEMPYTGQLWITSDALVDLAIAHHHGLGDVDGWVEEQFYQGDGPWAATDLFFYVDQSCSMMDDRANMAANFALFTASLANFDTDWQLMVSTRDNGCSNTGLLTAETPNVGQAFLDGIEGTSGRYTEAGLAVALNAIENAAHAGECNDGFLREDSKTLLVMVSDEPDQSPDYWADYVNDILYLAPTASFTAIVGDPGAGCATAKPGDHYLEAAAATGGAFLSICASDWGGYFQTLAALAAAGVRDTFALASTPDPATIEVRVDADISDVEEGPLATGWTYDGEQNAVVFQPDAVPASGTRISVSFALAGDCDA